MPAVHSIVITAFKNVSASELVSWGNAAWNYSPQIIENQNS